ncbi:MAG: ATP-dependent DNA helicase [Nitrospinae bacterium]|nr:ATP-dependent DNA helicase [Nitrospinota bacterium]
MPEIDEIFSPGGILSLKLDDYEHRPEQAKMARAVADALSSGGKLVVEAGTGTGKTMSYLVPAILSGLRVVVSTGTKNLQEQIFFRDIPLLREYLGKNFSSVMVKGRSNYLCSARLNKFIQAPLFKDDGDAKMLNNVFEWAQKTKTGDRAELEDMGEDDGLWAQICSTIDFCSARKCPRSTDCSISRLRREAEQAQIIVVNHHLFFADLALREKRAGTVLPDYHAVIFDEAHSVEEIASRYFGFSIGNYRIEELVRDSLRAADSASTENRRDIIEGLDKLEMRSKNFFYRFRNADGEERRFGLKDVKPDPESAELFLDSLRTLEQKTSSQTPLPDELRMVAHRFRSMTEEAEKILSANDDGYIFWGEARGGGVYLNASSMNVANTLQNALYGQGAVVFTSATLATAGDFAFFLSRLGLEGAQTLALASPFDFEKQVKIYLPPMPDPADHGFVDALAKEGERLIKLVRGRTLFLFTSFKVMYEVRKRLEGKIPYKILTQGEAPRHTLLGQFRDDVDSVLLASSSFWQGVDVKGESLSCVIIDKLPFSSPGDPITSARIDRIKKLGGKPFMEYQVPEAVLALRQGIGRLVRHRNDKGIIMIADARLRKKGYGKTFLASLPPAPVLTDFKELSSAYKEKS